MDRLVRVPGIKRLVHAAAYLITGIGFLIDPFSIVFGATSLSVGQVEIDGPTPHTLGLALPLVATTTTTRKWP